MGKIVRISFLVLASLLFFSCSKDNNFDNGKERPQPSGETPTQQTRTVASPHNKVMILYSAGFHNLSGDQKRNIDELEGGYLPYKLNNDDILLVFARNTKSYGKYSIPSSPVLIRMSRDNEGNVLRDTLKTWPEETLAADAGTMNEVLTYVKDNFPAASYGMVFSSHGTGWLPIGYYDKGSSEEFDVWSAFRQHRSIGMDVSDKGAGLIVTEMSVEAMAEAIPMHLDYLLFDACMMGCVEVAYAFRDKVSVMGFSPSEVLSEGFDYTRMASLLIGEQCNPVAVCSSYVEKYLSKSGTSRSASISVVNLDYIDDLAELCALLFDKYRSEIASIKVTRTPVDGTSVIKYSPQNYYTRNKHWYYDLRDILVTAGAKEDDLALLDEVLSKLVIYENHTPSFLVNSPFQFHSCCGLSMFLPSDNTDKDLEEYYRNLSWNKATGLVSLVY